MASILAGLLGKEAGEAIAKPVEAVGNVIDNLFTSDDERLSRAEAIERLRQQPMLAQVEINKLDAVSKFWFQANWRPFIGWVCGVSLGMYFIPQYALAAFIWAKRCLIADDIVPFPASPDAIMELVLAMLGMAAMRGIEKMKGIK